MNNVRSQQRSGSHPLPNESAKHGFNPRPALDSSAECHGNELLLRPFGYTGPLSLCSASKVREWPEQANGFSLPPTLEVCRFATPTCLEGCYAKRGHMKFLTPQHAFWRNYRALLEAGTAERMAESLIELLDRMKCSVFRIHVSGEFFSAEYARAWVITCGEYPNVQFWTYTRSRDQEVLTLLHQTPNLALRLSCDRDNWHEMLALSRAFPGCGLSYYTVGEAPPPVLSQRARTLPGGLIVFPDHSVRKRLRLKGTCPTETSIHPWPKEGACVLCRRCFA